MNATQQLDMRNEIAEILRPYFKRTANFPEGMMSHYSDAASLLVTYFEAKYKVQLILDLKPQGSGDEPKPNPNG